MTQMSNPGAMALLGMHPNPVDSLDNLRRAGLNPGDVGCCGRQRPGIRGCPVADDCRFHLTSMGGFRAPDGEAGASRPHNVGYYLETDEGTVKEDWCSCHVFVRILQARADAGAALRLKGKPGELVQIVAQEGEKVMMRWQEKANVADKREEAEFVERIEEVVVPRYLGASDNPQISYAQKLAARRAERYIEDPAQQVGLPRLTREAAEQQIKPAGDGLIPLGGEGLTGND